MSVRFCPIASGSNGNCIYVGSSDAHILIDAGISGKRVDQSLSHMNVPRVSALFVTHEHSDHVSGVGVLARRYRIPVYATPKTWRFFMRHNNIGKVDASLVKTIEPGETVVVDGISVTAFDIPHDASQPVGYTLHVDGRKVSVATDIGHVTDVVREHIRGSHILLLESNHDIEMLQNGSYPKPLKERVLGARGHLSNASAGTLLCEVASEHMEYVYLGHLSEDNNRPMIALDTVNRILDAHGVSVRRLIVADRHGPGEMVRLEDNR